MASFGDLKTRIAVDLGDALGRLHGDEIGQAVLDAIEHYSDRPFWFLEESDAASIETVSGTEAYALPSDTMNLSNVTVTASGSTYSLEKQTWGWFRERQENPTDELGQPTDYVIYGNNLYLYPTPNDALTITLWQRGRLTALSADSDTNAWTNNAPKELIRAHAKMDLYNNRLLMPDAAAAMKPMVDLWYLRVFSESVDRLASGRIRPTCF